MQGNPRPIWLAYGFRPFFLLGSLWGVLLLASWLPVYFGLVQLPLALPAVFWHAHEMLIGFAGAVVAGFLLTAVPNWTGIATPRGMPLGALALLWLCGRVVSTFAGPHPTWPLVLLDLLFFPMVAWALAYPLLRARQPHNLIFLPLLGLMTVADGLLWLEQRAGITLSLYTLLLMIVLIGGRVIPFFTGRALPRHEPRRRRPVEVASVVSVLLALGAELGNGPPLWQSVCFAACAVANGVRLWGWSDARLLRVPLLWILYAGYACLPLGMLLKALGSPGSTGTHLLTAGCIGCMILGMMARVALGHTGRELRPARLTVLAFGLIVAAALVRSLVPVFLPLHSAHALWCAAALWCLAFVLYFWVYLPVLTQPRVDGQPG